MNILNADVLRNFFEVESNFYNNDNASKTTYEMSIKTEIFNLHMLLHNSRNSINKSLHNIYRYYKEKDHIEKLSDFLFGITHDFCSNKPLATKEGFFNDNNLFLVIDKKEYYILRFVDFKISGDIIELLFENCSSFLNTKDFSEKTKNIIEDAKPYNFAPIFEIQDIFDISYFIRQINFYIENNNKSKEKLNDLKKEFEECYNTLAAKLRNL